MSDRPWYPHYSADFVHGVVGLGAAEIGAYIVILDLIYDRGGSIPNDSRWIGGILGEHARRTRALIQHLVDAEKLFVADGQLDNKRAKSLREGEQKAAKRSTKGEQKAPEKEASFFVTIEENQSLIAASRARVPEPEPYKKESSPNGEPKKAASPRGSRLPPEWQLSLDDEAWALAQGLTSEQVARAALKFKNHWLSRSRDAARLDWSRTWQNWVLTDLERSKGNGHARQAKRTTADIAREFSDYARDRSEDHRPPVRVLPRGRP